MKDGGVFAVDLRWNPRRRTRVGVSFSPTGALLIDAPPGTSVAEVRSLLRSHGRWIRYRSRAAAKTAGSWYPAAYVDDAVLFYRGRAVVLQLAAGPDVELRDAVLVAPRDDTRRRLHAWYARRADEVLAAAVAKLVPALSWLDVAPPWRHRYMRAQWGSCTAGGRITLNTHLVKLPDALIEYVIAHEMCHLRYMNHGPDFHRLMDASMADWKQRRRQLNHHVGLLRESMTD